MNNKISFNELCDWEELERKGELSPEKQEILNIEREKIRPLLERLRKGLLNIASVLTATISPGVLERIAKWSKKKDRCWEEAQKLYPFGYSCFMHYKQKPAQTISRLRKATRKKLNKYGVYIKSEGHGFNTLCSEGLDNVPEGMFLEKYLKVSEQANKIWNSSPYEAYQLEFGLKCIRRFNNLPENVRGDIRTYFRKRKDLISTEPLSTKDPDFKVPHKLIRDALLDHRTLEPNNDFLFKAIIKRAIESLSEKQKEAVILYYFREFTQAEASRRLGIKESSFKERLDNAHNTLRSTLFPLFSHY